MMNYLKNFFKHNEHTNKNQENQVKKIYKELQYKYTCDVCGSYEVKVNILGTTEKFCGPYTDYDGIIHTCHDTNEGEVELTCANNHITHTNYIASCECGWNSKNSH
jgi:hypothetical protein